MKKMLSGQNCAIHIHGVDGPCKGSCQRLKAHETIKHNKHIFLKLKTLPPSPMCLTAWSYHDMVDVARKFKSL